MKYSSAYSIINIIAVSGLVFNLYSLEQDSSYSTGNKNSRDSIVSLDKMIVTATKTERLMSETPASVSVISQNEIAVAPAKNIDDLLMKQTGVQMRRVAGMTEGIPSDIIIRGIPGPLSATRTLVLVDGIPTNVSGTPFMILNEVPLNAVKSIEIVRGPYSSLYGANAFGGVVNVLTKAGYGKPKIGLTFETSYPFTVIHQYAVNDESMKTSLRESGQETYWNIDGSTSGGNDRIQYLVTAGFRNIGNYLLRDTAISRNGDLLSPKNRENHDYRDIRLFGKYSFNLGNRTNITTHARYFNSDLGFGKTKNIKHLFPDSMDIITKGEKILIGPIAKISVNENVDLKIGGFVRRLVGEFWNEFNITFERSSSDSSVRSYWKSESNDWQVESQGIFRPGSSNVVTTGVELLRNNIDFGAMINPENDEILPNSFALDTSIVNFGAYIQDELSLFKVLNVVPGIRLDYHSEFGSAVSPKLGISYKIIEQIVLQSSVGRAFRAPTLSELYMPDLTIRPDMILRSNPDLKPEYIWAVDANVEIMPFKLMRIKIGFFNNSMKDLICPKVDLDSDYNIDSSAITYDNTSGAWSRGIESELDLKLKDWLHLFGNFVYQKSRDTSASYLRKKFDRSDTLVPLDYIPETSSSFGLRIKKQIGKYLLEVSLSESYIGKRSFQEWTAIDQEEDVKIQMTLDGTKVYIIPPVIELELYWRTDLGIKFSFKKHVWLALNIQNIFDAVYEESSGTWAPGRFASIKLGADF